MRNLIFKTVVATTFLVSASAAHAEIGGVPMPQTPTQQRVPPQHEYDPAIGRDIYVPPPLRGQDARRAPYSPAHDGPRPEWGTADLRAGR